MSVELLWVCLFMFSLTMVIFGVTSLATGKKYWRFGVGFGVAVSLMPLWLWFIAPIIKGWQIPLLLFVGIPITVVGLGVAMLVAVGLGMWLYGKEEENYDATGKQTD